MDLIYLLLVEGVVGAFLVWYFNDEVGLFGIGPSSVLFLAMLGLMTMTTLIYVAAISLESKLSKTESGKWAGKIVIVFLIGLTLWVWFRINT